MRSNGLRAIELNEEDTLIGVAITDGEQQIMLFSNEGKAIRFAETDVRAMGRSAKGVRGMRVTIGAAQAEEAEDADTECDAAIDGARVFPYKGKLLGISEDSKGNEEIRCYRYQLDRPHLLLRYHGRRSRPYVSGHG